MGGRLGAETCFLMVFFKAIPEAVGIGFIYPKGWVNDPLQPRILKYLEALITMEGENRTCSRWKINYLGKENSWCLGCGVEAAGGTSHHADGRMPWPGTYALLLWEMPLSQCCPLRDFSHEETLH